MTVFRVACYLLALYFAIVLACGIAGAVAAHGEIQTANLTTTSVQEPGR